MSSTTADPYVSGIDEGAEHGHGFDEEAFDAGELRSERPRPPRPPRPIGRFGAVLFSLTGLGLVVAGGALASAPYWSWQVEQVAAQMAALGVAPGALLVAGVALFATGRVGRSLSKLAARPPVAEPEVVDAVSRMAEHVSMLAGTVARMQEQVTHLGLRDPIVNVSAPPPDEDLVGLYRDQKDAVFRLAASLDKLAMNVTDQLAREIGSLDRHFDAVRGELASARDAFESGLDRVVRSNEERAAATPEPPAPLPGSPAPEVGLHPMDRPATEPADLAAAPVAEAAPSEEIRLEEPHPELETETSPLSFLDGLKDIAPPSQNPHSPSVEAPPLDFDLLDAPTAPLPGQRPEERQPGPGSHTS